MKGVFSHLAGLCGWNGREVMGREVMGREWLSPPKASAPGRVLPNWVLSGMSGVQKEEEGRCFRVSKSNHVSPQDIVASVSLPCTPLAAAEVGTSRHHPSNHTWC